MRHFISRPEPGIDDEVDFMSTLGRTRRPVSGEWDDYVLLYADFENVLIECIEHDLQSLPPEHFQCPMCEIISPTYRGITVHLSRTHDIKSARADYFASRKDA